MTVFKQRLLVYSVAFLVFSLSACEFNQKQELPLSPVESKLELKKLSDELIKTVLDGAEQQKVSKLVRRINSISELVVIGRIKNQETAGQHTGLENIYRSYFLVEVEEVKRGDFPWKEVKFLFGMFGDTWPVALYPGYVKTRYHAGDRVKVFLNHFD